MVSPALLTNQLSKENTTAVANNGGSRTPWFGAAREVHELNPLQDPRWMCFVDSHPKASIFHTCEWLRALRDTYGYEPVAFTSSRPDEQLRNVVVFCRVNSWVTGQRLVSLPFSDHCEPLVDSDSTLQAILRSLMQRCCEQYDWNYKYIELRPLCDTTLRGLDAPPSASFFIHRLPLTGTSDELFNGLHKSSVQRKIKRAQREGLGYEEGRCERLIHQFYRLLLVTRRRRGLPPQPYAWFRSLALTMGNRLTVRLAFKDNVPIAGVLTLAHRNTVVYKYGASDDRFHNLGAIQLLFWHTIREAKAAGYSELDLGRSDISQGGLITFKDRLGAVRAPLRYFRFPSTDSLRPGNSHFNIARQICAYLPLSLLPTVGKVLYRHLG